ncbi:MAG: hypothetical protein WAL75_02115 [Terracidiphilus sp.]
MIIQPNSSFPLLASDQAEVIQIFLELMQERGGPAHGPEVRRVTRPLASPNQSLDSKPPHELFDYE